MSNSMCAEDTSSPLEQYELTYELISLLTPARMLVRLHIHSRLGPVAVGQAVTNWDYTKNISLNIDWRDTRSHI